MGGVDDEGVSRQSLISRGRPDWPAADCRSGADINKQNIPSSPRLARSIDQTNTIFDCHRLRFFPSEPKAEPRSVAGGIRVPRRKGGCSTCPLVPLSTDNRSRTTTKARRKVQHRVALPDQVSSRLLEAPNSCFARPRTPSPADLTRGATRQDCQIHAPIRPHDAPATIRQQRLWLWEGNRRELPTAAALSAAVRIGRCSGRRPSRWSRVVHATPRFDCRRITLRRR